MVKVFQIRIGKHQTGIIGLEEALKEMSEEKQRCDELNIEQRWPQLSCYKVKVNTESYNQLLRKE